MFTDIAIHKTELILCTTSPFLVKLSEYGVCVGLELGSSRKQHFVNYTVHTPLLHGPHPTITRSTPHYYTVHTPLLHGPHPTITRSTPHYYTVHTPLLHGPHPTITRSTPHYYTVHTPLLHGPHPTITRSTSHYYTVHIPLLRCHRWDSFLNRVTSVFPVVYYTYILCRCMHV